MNEKKKKQVPLRLSEKLYNDIAAWAEDDFRSVNGQIEYLLTECVRQRKKMANMFPNTWMNRWILLSNEFLQKGAVAPKTAYALWQGFMLCMESLPYFFE